MQSIISRLKFFISHLCPVFHINLLDFLAPLILLWMKSLGRLSFGIVFLSLILQASFEGHSEIMTKSQRSVLNFDPMIHTSTNFCLKPWTYDKKTSARRNLFLYYVCLCLIKCIIESFYNMKRENQQGSKSFYSARKKRTGKAGKGRVGNWFRVSYDPWRGHKASTEVFLLSVSLKNNSLNCSRKELEALG